ncbi:TspO/MBR family protein [Mycobacterium sp. URHB0044]|jgi:benzodiazapine receptor|uniref:TspO/MBR family protein n=1 Tax=Mycobacterium sp. URHB0044 TaxID=1380386 RepID=UPI0004904032|nr:TspO/MBR family protein [Mycobacterium sp. URHB0044]
MRAITLAKTTTAVLLTAAIGGLASRPAQSDWYENLRKPSFQPPRQAFPIVWPLLYADIAAVSASTVDKLNGDGRHDEARTYSRLLALNLILNGGWTWLFFSRRKLGTSAVAAAALTVSSSDLTRRAVRTHGTAAGALGLYPLWCAFATLLSSRIWWLNRRGG